MSVRTEVLNRIDQALAACEAEGLWARGQRTTVLLERPKQDDHGDLATNVAMTLAKAARKNPREIATAVVRHLKASPTDPVLTGAEVAGPGFINLRLNKDLYFADVVAAAALGDQFGRTSALKGQKVIVEFVSANPTGPMHVGHGRGAIVGDVISRLLDAAGAAVHREYYINDAGNQIAHLGHALYVRAQEEIARRNPGAGITPDVLDKDDYQGEYILDLARVLLEPLDEAGQLKLVRTPYAAQADQLQQTGVELVMRTMIRRDLALFNIQFDQFFSERSLHTDGRIVQAIKELEERGVAKVEKLAPPKGQERDPDASDEPLLVMKTTQYGDDVDRPLRKPDGTYTYFAGDVAYHWDKLQRGFTRVINIWGADHGGYVARVRAAIQALGHDPKAFEVVLVQMVNLVKNGEPFKMSKRSGTFVTLRDVIEEAGADATRVFFIMRSANSAFDFDLALAQKQTADNPVFYVQYGHARACSIQSKAKAQGIALPAVTVENLRGLTLPEELDILKRLLSFPDVVAGAAQALEPHRIVFFLQETIATFHSYLTRYKHTEKVLTDDVVKTQARLALVEMLRLTLANALHMIGVSAPEQMSREVTEEVEA
jgi:arginyl-tRNA synthetase